MLPSHYLSREVCGKAAAASVPVLVMWGILRTKTAPFSRGSEGNVAEATRGLKAHLPTPDAGKKADVAG